MSHSASPYTQMDDLMALRFQVKSRRLTHQQKLISEKGGYHQAIRKGRGMEFSEVREYTPGDDVRHIDWKVSARTQKTHTKVFTEELEKPVVCVLEQTPKLFFGSRSRFKSDTALQLMAALSWVTLQQGDRFGALVFNHLSHYWVEPRHHPTAVMQCFQHSLALQKQLTSPGTSQSEHWLTQLSQLQRHLRPGTRIVLIGDFLNSDDAFIEKLSQLKRHTDMLLIHVYDPLEVQLPKVGQLKLTDGQRDRTLNTLDKAFREDYTQLYQQAWQTLQQQLAPWHLPLVDISTDDDPVQALVAQGIIR